MVALGDVLADSRLGVTSWRTTLAEGVTPCRSGGRPSV